ncbi:hypothetical protein CASFOL_015547 [Castilleja foliolosa]|uniref:RWP-RK domain-containing protein n=1 Tax=Castilleja foliolosa TaxID=1961234 RepID=A0ABD3DHH5_9LAMI
MEGDIGSLNNMGWSNYNIQEVIYDDVFPFPSQLPPVDFRFETSGFFGISELDNNFQIDPFCMQQNYNSNVVLVDDVPISEMFLNDAFYSSPDIHAQNNNHTSIPEIFYCDSGSLSSGLWDQEMQNQLVSLDNMNNNNTSSNWALVDNNNNNEKKVGKKRPSVEVKNSTSHVMSSSSIKDLSRETISQYFYMPITKAARELNVGLTLLKKRCRDLGIRRWPHRKLISLQTLIKNVQELGGDEGSSRKGESNEYLRVLEQEKKLLEEIPDMQLEVATKRLRQAFFKANYKKRKLMGLVDSCSTTKSKPSDNDHITGASASASASTTILAGGHENGVNFCDSKGRVDDAGYDDDEIKYFLDDCFSCE